jgi:DNA-directed RNA polymerase specialized sigma24 family protein
LEDYLRETKGKTAADFATLKAFSNDDYYKTDRSTYRQTWKNTSLDTLADDKNEIFAIPSVEDEVIERFEQEAAYAKRSSTASLALDKLTAAQRRRYLMHHFQGKTTREIAALEGVNQSKITNSLRLAEKKIKKILSSCRKMGVQNAYFFTLYERTFPPTAL